MSYEQYVSEVKKEFASDSNMSVKEVDKFFADKEIQTELQDSYEIFVGDYDEDLKSVAYPAAVASDLAMM